MDNVHIDCGEIFKGLNTFAYPNIHHSETQVHSALVTVVSNLILRDRIYYDGRAHDRLFERIKGLIAVLNRNLQEQNIDIDLNEIFVSFPSIDEDRKYDENSVIDKALETWIRVKDIFDSSKENIVRLFDIYSNEGAMGPAEIVISIIKEHETCPPAEEVFDRITSNETGHRFFRGLVLNYFDELKNYQKIGKLDQSILKIGFAAFRHKFGILRAEQMSLIKRESIYYLPTLERRLLAERSNFEVSNKIDMWADVFEPHLMNLQSTRTNSKNSHLNTYCTLILKSLVKLCSDKFDGSSTILVEAIKLRENDLVRELRKSIKYIDNNYTIDEANGILNFVHEIYKRTMEDTTSSTKGFIESLEFFTSLKTFGEALDRGIAILLSKLRTQELSKGRLEELCNPFVRIMKLQIPDENCCSALHKIFKIDTCRTRYERANKIFNS